MAFFRYFGQCIELNIRNASSLSSVFIGGDTGHEIAYAFEPLSKYFPQLEVLYLRIPLGVLSTQYNIGVEHLQLPLLTTLKVLELHIFGDHSFSLLGWTPLIEACVVLEKLIVKFDCYDIGLNGNITKRGGSPLKSLKTLEIFGYCGRRIDIELATYVFENAVNLQHVFVEVELMPYNVSPDSPIRISKLKEIIPEGVSFVLKES
ncbi:uncharacterized protein LOC141596631 [Silene latifolia]|uniref:uncharacterized protein LOC141596631 n=1 Tax=Silene latifolia TaxID=37657 RepID=UPI003D779E96